MITLLPIGCGSGPLPSASTVTSSLQPVATAHTSASASALDPREIAGARRFRTDFGLRADEAWIRQVAVAPASADGQQKFGIPLMPDEVEELERRTIEVEAIRQLVIAYGLAHPDDYAGTWIDQQGGGFLVTQFSRRVDEHRAALLSRVSPRARLTIRAVRWNLAHLQAEAARIDPADPWFRTLPAVVMAAGVDEPTNRVYIRISSFNPAATRLIEDHFGWRETVLVESDGTGALLLPRGSLAITARDTNGNPVPRLRCIAIPDMPGAYEAPVDAPRTDARGRCRVELPATGYWIRLERTQDPNSYVAIERAVVLPGRTNEVAITVTMP